MGLHEDFLHIAGGMEEDKYAAAAIYSSAGCFGVAGDCACVAVISDCHYRC